ncbi:MAG: RsmB/NOP family class I SAM-dependent RNA methyltransferase [Candidatus Hodarchaeales archaeon]
MSIEENLEQYINNIQVASKIISFYEMNQISLRNAMKEYSHFSNDENRHSYSQVHALVFETVRYQNIGNRIIHQQIQNQFGQKIPENVRNTLRVIIYLFVLAPESQQDHFWTLACIEILKSLDFQFSTAIFSNLTEYLNEWSLEVLLEQIKDNEEKVGVQFAHPTWLVRDLQSFYGLELTKDILATNNLTLPVYLRLNLLKFEKNIIISQLSKEGVSIEPDPIMDDVIKVISTDMPIPRLPSFKDDLYYMQTKGSSLISHILDPKEGEKILDACAAPGGKTTHLATLQGDSGFIVATDNHKRRMQELVRKVCVYNLKSIHPILFDMRLDRSFRTTFDKILLDAPCSGSGTFSSRPDAKWRIDRHQVKWLRKLQFALLQNVSTMLTKNQSSYIIYSTCSLLPMENEDVIEQFLITSPQFELKEQKLYIGTPSPKFPLAQRLFPHINETEGFSIFKIGYKDFS